MQKGRFLPALFLCGLSRARLAPFQRKPGSPDRVNVKRAPLGKPISFCACGTLCSEVARIKYSDKVISILIWVPLNNE